MNAKEADKIAKKMVRDKTSVYARKYSLAFFNGGKLFTESAEKKVLDAFYKRVLDSNNYHALEKMYAEDQLS